MSRVTYREALPEDALDIAQRLRDDDLLELSLASTMPPSELLLYSLHSSEEAYVAEQDGKVIALWGFGIIPGTVVGCPWMVGSPESLQHPIKLVRIGREMVSRWSKRCLSMHNFTLKGNVAHAAWLRRIGFEMGEEVRYGPFSAPFIQFYRKT